MLINPYHFKVGYLECIVFNEGVETRNVLDLFVGVSPNEVRQAAQTHKLQPDAVPFSINILCVKTGREIVVVDTGLGFPAMPGGGRLPQSLKEAGIDTTEVTLVIITHQHFDHIGGLINATGETVFSNARYAFWKTEWEDWTSPEKLAKLSPEDAAQRQARIDIIKPRLTLLDTEAEIITGITAVPAPGHTSGHMALLVHSDGQGLLHLADAAHHPMQIIHSDWSPVFDSHPDLSRLTRKALFERIADEKLQMLAYHFAAPGLGYITREHGALRWQAVE